VDDVDEYRKKDDDWGLKKGVAAVKQLAVNLAGDRSDPTI